MPITGIVFGLGVAALGVGVWAAGRRSRRLAWVAAGLAAAAVVMSGLLALSVGQM